MQYILTQLVDATPAIRIITRNGDEIFLADMQGIDDLSIYADIEDGYLVSIPGREEPIWYGKQAFEAFALPVIEDPDLPTIPRGENTEPKAKAPTVSEAMVDHMIDDIEVMTIGEKTTLSQAKLRNGFIIIDSSSCVSPENYNEAVGAEICEHRIRAKAWDYLGFLLQTARNGVRGW